MSYELTTKTYQGPLEKLLELIEDKKLDITTVSLAEVTADFLGYLEKLQKEAEESHITVTPEILADFIAVASKLILIKSKAILPSLELSEEEEGDIRDLETRLALYRELKATHTFLKDSWSEIPQLFARELLSTSDPLFYPPSQLTVNNLLSTVQKVAGELERFLKPTSTIKTDIINIKAKIEEVIMLLTNEPTSFRKLQTKEGKRDLVALFLALLHMIKQQLIHVEQRKHFGDITVSRKQAESEAQLP